MSVIAVIPARGGSTRIPRKNIRLFHGEPVITYSIKTAKLSGLFDRILVSTDDAEIAEVANYAGAGVIFRPRSLADNSVGTQAVTSHAIQAVGGDYCCCIYPTAPMMLASDITRAFELVYSDKFSYAFSVGVDPLRDAGQFYWGNAKAFLRGISLYGPHSAMVPIDELRVCDINTEDDWLRAERMFSSLEARR